MSAIAMIAATCGTAVGPAAAAVSSGARAITAQSSYLALAEQAVSHAQSDWADRRHHWYDARLDDGARYPQATIWDAAPLFEAIDAIEIAQPSPAHRAAVARFAAGAERYLNRGLRPLPGFSPYPGDRSPSTETWFDDNGWWGLGFVNAYRATGSRRYLTDAQRALNYIAAAGWDATSGGIWWNTTHPYKAGEALASGTLLATLLYQQTGSAFDLAQAQKYLGWGNTSGFSASAGLYTRSDRDPTPEDYIEAPLAYAQEVLCLRGADPEGCGRAGQLANVALRRFGSTLDFAPQYDAIYLQWMLALYGSDHDARLYQLAAANAQSAAAHARNGLGLYLLSWTGEPLTTAQVLAPNMLQTQAATASLFAWLAVYAPPA